MERRDDVIATLPPPAVMMRSHFSDDGTIRPTSTILLVILLSPLTSRP